MNEPKQPVYLSPIGRVVYPSVYGPNRWGTPEQPEWDVTLVWSDAKEIAAMKKQILEAAKAKWGPEAARALKSPLRRCEEKPKLEDMGFAPTDVFVRFKTKKQPKVVDQNVHELEEAEGLVYSGCYGRVSYEIFSWQHESGGRGISLYLRNFQWHRHGVRLVTPQSSADTEFDALPVEDGDEAFQMPFDMM